jgi:hypothetical protein
VVVPEQLDHHAQRCRAPALAEVAPDGRTVGRDPLIRAHESLGQAGCLTPARLAIDDDLLPVRQVDTQESVRPLAEEEVAAHLRVVARSDENLPALTRGEPFRPVPGDTEVSSHQLVVNGLGDMLCSC